jgi:hypothetical protein
MGTQDQGTLQKNIKQWEKCLGDADFDIRAGGIEELNKILLTNFEDLSVSDQEKIWKWIIDGLDDISERVPATATNVLRSTAHLMEANTVNHLFPRLIERFYVDLSAELELGAVHTPVHTFSSCFIDILNSVHIEFIPTVLDHSIKKLIEYIKLKGSQFSETVRGALVVLGHVAKVGSAAIKKSQPHTNDLTNENLRIT